MCNKEQLEIIKNKAAEFAKDVFKEKLDSVILYGSYARGDFDSDSDVDIILLVDIDRGELVLHNWEVSKFASRLSLEFEILISISLQDKATFTKYQDALPYYRNIAKEGVKVYA